MTKSIAKEVFISENNNQEKELIQTDDKYFITIENEVVEESFLLEDALNLFYAIC